MEMELTSAKMVIYESPESEETPSKMFLSMTPTVTITVAIELKAIDMYLYLLQMK